MDNKGLTSPQIMVYSSVTPHKEGFLLQEKLEQLRAESRRSQLNLAVNSLGCRIEGLDAAIAKLKKLGSEPTEAEIEIAIVRLTIAKEQLELAKSKLAKLIQEC